MQIPYATAVLEYENKRHKLQKEFNNEFGSWKKKYGTPQESNKPIYTGASLRPPPQDINQPESETFEDNVELIKGLWSIYSSYVQDTITAYAILLRRLQVDKSLGQGEVDKFVEVLLDEVYRYKWCYAIEQMRYFLPSFQHELLSETWKYFESSIRERNSKTYIRLCSPRLKWRQILEYDAVAGNQQTLKRLEQKIESIINSSKRRRSPHKPNKNEKAIIDAINEGCRGVSFCHFLDAHNVGPRSGWELKSNPFPWPGCYVNAYTKSHVKSKNFWRKRIQDYKNDTQGKFPSMINRKKSVRNSRTRRGE